MSKVFIGSIVNGWKVLKMTFKSIISSKSIYKVKCIICGTKTKLRACDLEHEKCECQSTKETKPKRNISFKKTNMMGSIGVTRGKYKVVGFLYKDADNVSPSMITKRKQYIVKCSLCGSLCIMSNNNLNRSKEKRDKNVRCNHKHFFDKSSYKENEYYLEDK